MKLLRLDLRAFGHFSHKLFEFDPQKNIHVIFGENEAGKSCFTRALKSLLFGIEKKTTDNYLHDKENLLIEGLIESDSGKMIQILREHKLSRKQNQQILDLFPYIDKESFTNLYCLNQSVIQMGSKDLMENLKHFDVSLFNSYNGKEGILNLLQKLQKEFEGLYKLKGSKPTINQKIEIAHNLINEKEIAGLGLEKWKVLEASKKTAIKELTSFRKKKESLEKKLKEEEALLEFYEELTRLEDLNNKLRSVDFTKTCSLETIAKFEKLLAQLRKVEESINDKERSIDEFEKTYDKKTYDSNLANARLELEIVNRTLADQRILENKIDSLQKELKINQVEFKELNLALQKNVSLSISEKEWQNQKNKLIQISNNLEVKEKAHKEEIKVLQQKVDEDYQNIKNIINRLNQYNFSKKISFKEEYLNDFSSFNLNKLVSIKDEYNQLIGQLVSINKSIDLSRSKQNDESNFDSFIQKIDSLKSLQVPLKLELLDNWTEVNFKEKHETFKQYQTILDLEKKEIDKFFKNLETFSVGKKLSLEIKKLENEKKLLKTKISKLVSPLIKNKYILNRITTEIDIYDVTVGNAFIEYCLKFEEFVLLLSQYKKDQNQIVQLSEKNNLEKYKEEWKLLSDKLQLNISFNSNCILNFSESLDAFFRLSKNIELKNKLLKEMLLKTKKYDDQLKKISLKFGFTNLLKSNVSLYLNRSKAESLTKEAKEKLLFHIKEKQKELRNEVCVKDNLNQKLNDFAKKNKCKTNIQLADLVEKSKNALEIEKSVNELKKFLDFKLNPLGLNYYIKKKISYKSLEDLIDSINELKGSVQNLSNENDEKQKILGEIEYQEKSFLSFGQKLEISKKLQGVSFELTEDLDRYLLAKSSFILIKKVLWNFQKKHQHLLLDMVSKYFQKMTGGKYIKVSLNFLDQKESFLICETKLGQKVTVDLLSEGTRDQLFFSFKLAVGQLALSNKTNVPLILDDVLVNFDDERSLNTFNLLSDLSSDTQIFFLTHHKHILNLIEKSELNDQVQWHSLDRHATI